QLPRELASELNRAIEPRREAPLRMLIVEDSSARATSSSVLVLTWFHPLMDARGGEILLTHLNELDTHEDTPRGDRPPAFVSERGRDAPEGGAGRDLWESSGVPLRAIPARRDRGRARAGADPSSSDGRGGSRRTDRGQPGRAGVPAVPARVANAASAPVDGER